MNVMHLAGLAALFAAGSANAQVPVEIISDEGEYSRGAGTSVFTGNVIATQDGARITTDKLTLSCLRDAIVDSAGKCEPERLVAEGNVIYAGKDVKIRGDHALYDYVSETVTVTGDVIVARGVDGVMRGDKVIYNVSDGVTRISGGSDRVRGVFGAPRN